MPRTLRVRQPIFGQQGRRTWAPAPGFLEVLILRDFEPIFAEVLILVEFNVNGMKGMENVVQLLVLNDFKPRRINSSETSCKC
jgi:hypothetical protein